MPSSKPEVSMSKMRCDLLQLHIPPNSSEEHFNFQVGFTKQLHQALRILVVASGAQGKKTIEIVNTFLGQEFHSLTEFLQGNPEYRCYLFFVLLHCSPHNGI
jgi:hypothetical protein